AVLMSLWQPEGWAEGPMVPPLNTCQVDEVLGGEQVRKFTGPESGVPESGVPESAVPLSAVPLAGAPEAGCRGRLHVVDGVPPSSTPLSSVLTPAPPRPQAAASTTTNATILNIVGTPTLFPP